MVITQGGLANVIDFTSMGTSSRVLSDFHNHLKEMALDKGITQRQIARALEVSQSQISVLLNDMEMLKKQGLDFFVSFVQAFGFSRAQAQELAREVYAQDYRKIFGLEGIEKYAVDLDFVKVPVIGVASAGAVISGQTEDYINLPKTTLRGRKIENIAAVQVDTNCLISHNVKYHQQNIAHGDFVAIDTSVMPQKDSIVLAWDSREDKLILKVYKENEKNLFLYDSEGLMIPYPQLAEHISIRGVVIWRGGDYRA